MYVFTQQVGGFQDSGLKNAIKTCEEHPKCIECPMVNGQVVENIICETGKGKENK